jgi:DNA-binding CsgD family transcriptional regulator
VFCGGARRPVAVSDFLTAAQLRGRQIHDTILEPLGIADSLRLYLPGQEGMTRFFFFDRSRRGFSPRSRRLLELLRPTLERARESWSAPQWSDPAPLTSRELEVLRWVAAGLTNAEVGRRLWLSPHTVRTHLEHAYRKLGVRTRTEAVARLR